MTTRWQHWNKIWKFHILSQFHVLSLKENGIPDHLTCLLRNLYAGQEASYNWTWKNRLVPNRGRSTSSCILSPCLFNLCTEDIMWNARLDELEAVIKIAKRNINNLRYADDTTLMAESEEALKSLLMKVKEESEKASLKLSIKKRHIMASSPIIS